MSRAWRRRSIGCGANGRSGRAANCRRRPANGRTLPGPKASRPTWLSSRRGIWASVHSRLAATGAVERAGRRRVQRQRCFSARPPRADAVGRRGDGAAARHRVGDAGNQNAAHPGLGFLAMAAPGAVSNGREGVLFDPQTMKPRITDPVFVDALQRLAKSETANKPEASVRRRPSFRCWDLRID